MLTIPLWTFHTIPLRTLTRTDKLMDLITAVSENLVQTFFFKNLCSNRREQACDLLRQFGTTGNTSRLSQIGALSLHPLEFSCIAVFLHTKKIHGAHLWNN